LTRQLSKKHFSSDFPAFYDYKKTLLNESSSADNTLGRGKPRHKKRNDLTKHTHPSSPRLSTFSALPTMADPPVAALKDDQSPGETLEEAKADEENEEKEEDKTEAKATAGASDSDEEKEDNRKCNYRDYSHVQPPDPSSNAAPAIPRRNPPNKEATFPMKLHVIISSPEFWEISWLPHGRSWRINNPKSFEERVIPIFFRHGRYTSFARQVNGWGFRRITHGSDFNSYYHEVSSVFLERFDSLLAVQESAFVTSFEHSGHFLISIECHS